MENTFQYDRKQEIIRTTWAYMQKHGLMNSSIGTLCRETGLAQSSLYHWFSNKDDIWISAGKYGLSKVVTVLLDYTFDHTDNIEGFFAGFLDEVDKYKEELRLAIQITTSPVFGERMREKSRSFRTLYMQYAERLMNKFSVTELKANIFIYSVISIVMDYVIWDDKDLAQMLLDNLHGHVNNNLNLD